MAWEGSRFIPGPLLLGHVKAVGDYREPGEPKRARWVIVLMALVSIAAGCVVGFGEIRLNAAGALLAAVSLLSGGMLAAFTHLSTLRKAYTDRESEWPEGERVARDYLDETAAHLLTGSYVAAWCAASLVVTSNLSKIGAPIGWWATVPVSLATYLFLVFLIAVPRLYVAYARLNRLRPEISGIHSKT